MKNILTFNLFLALIIIIISYISTPENQILLNHHYLIGYFFVLIFMTALWILSLLAKDASIVDIFWGPAFIVLAASLFNLMGVENNERSQWLLAFITIWGLRLAFHIGIRNVGHGEDFRYVQWRKEGGENYWIISLFRVFILQGSLATLVGVSIYFGFLNTAHFGDLEKIVLCSFFILGILWESISDIQLIQFRKNPENKGKIIQSGLWKFSRHPNYFGDLMVWISIVLFSVSSKNFLFIAMSTISPLLMGLIFYKITGPIMDNALALSKHGYKEYMQNSNSLIPKLFRRKIK